MITHIVLFRLKDQGAESIEKAKERILSMEGKVEQLRHLEVGTDVIRSERSYDLALITKFDSLEDLNAYQVHPYHADEVAAYMRSVSAAVAVVDFES
ncbi:Dabb family protein [Geomonas sp. RF6]|uniref:Dabb family protein n=1 Tax=Geomonas sp. RF6 TaxID=2897342 RepID=UPI001E2A568F|nr:Dabb family protein [Geomonas sp. RF6]UFS71015.1 Dabb family protein [Geomonas sp. RF6]